jgi:hypothetical protein
MIDQLCVEKLRQSLWAIPNDGRDFDLYIRIFGMLKWLSLYGGWPDFVCFKLWDEWAAKNKAMYHECVQIEHWARQEVPIDFPFAEGGQERLIVSCHEALCWGLGYGLKGKIRAADILMLQEEAKRRSGQAQVRCGACK